MGYNMMVEPAKRGEVVGIVILSLCPRAHMVGLGPIAAVAAVDGATAVSPPHEPANRRWYRSGHVRCCDGFSVGETDNLDSPTA